VSEAALREVGGGLVVSLPASHPGRGQVAVVTELDDVLALLDRDDLDQVFLWVDDPTVTAVAPVLEDVAGVLCTTGGPTAHVAIVSRDLDLLCLMRCEVEDPAALDGGWVRIDGDGRISLEE
jgi:phosphoenolpyruvate synthase/pyruvate phosphate dikinase